MTLRSIRHNSLLMFFILTYFIMLLTWGLMAILQIPGCSTEGFSSSNYFGLPLFFLGGFSPSIAGIILTQRIDGRKGLHDLWQRARQFNLGWTAYLLIFLLPIIVFALRFALHSILGGSFATSLLLTRPLTLVGFTVTVIIGGPISEEFGWRGFALDRLLNRYNLAAANIILGLLWAFWHLPLFFIPGTTQAAHGNTLAEFAIFAVWILGLTLLYSWLQIKTGRSLFAAILFHATINWWGSFAGTLIVSNFTEQLINSMIVVLVGTAVMIWYRPIRRPIALDRLRNA